MESVKVLFSDPLFVFNASLGSVAIASGLPFSIGIFSIHCSSIIANAFRSRYVCGTEESLKKLFGFLNTFLSVMSFLLTFAWALLNLFFVSYLPIFIFPLILSLMLFLNNLNKSVADLSDAESRKINLIMLLILALSLVAIFYIF